jgi:glucose/arabinose dehydrogenase
MTAIGGAALAAALVVACSAESDDEASRASSTARTSVTAVTPGHSRAAPAATGVRLVRVGRFDSPTYLAAPPRDPSRRFVVERGGRIVVLHGGRRATFLDISDQVSTDGEGGLLSMAFAPDYASSGRFYIYYVASNGYIAIDQYRATGDRAQPGSRRQVIRVRHTRPNHKGGQLQFGADGKLYAGFGDGGGGGDPDRNAQDLGELLGKLIRIDPRPDGGYDVPADNPFRGRAGARGEIYVYGLRNPYRFSFDQATGALTIGDVGQDAVEEIDYLPGRAGRQPPRGGANFGWSVFEGRSRYNGGSASDAVAPVITHTHDAGWSSIIGGYVLRDPALPARLRGRYVYGDLSKPGLRSAKLRAGRSASRPLGVSVPALDSFGEDARGRVYAISLDGPVYRIAARR